MDNTAFVLNAIAGETRLKIIKLLLKRNYCVGALARHLDLTEAAVSQHLKVLREAGLLIGEKLGYFMHYDVDREQLQALAKKIEALTEIKREACRPDVEGCMQEKRNRCRAHKSGNECSKEVRFTCHEQKTNN